MPANQHCPGRMVDPRISVCLSAVAAELDFTRRFGRNCGRPSGNSMIRPHKARSSRGQVVKMLHWGKV